MLDDRKYRKLQVLVLRENCSCYACVTSYAFAFKAETLRGASHVSALNANAYQNIGAQGTFVKFITAID
jgi:hypothetical protein